MNSDQAKEKGLYNLAGGLAYVEGLDGVYGCHYGLRSKRDKAAQSFAKGWATARDESDTTRPVWEAR